MAAVAETPQASSSTDWPGHLTIPPQASSSIDRQGRLLVLDPIDITRRTDLSLIYKILRIAVLWPLRPHLVSYKKKYPGGSQRLYQLPQRLHGITIRERKVEIPNTASPADYGMTNPYSFTQPDYLWIYDFEPPTTGFTASSIPPAMPSSSFVAASGRRKSSVAAAGTHTIYYFAGGGFRAPPSSEHWKLCAHMASSLSLIPFQRFEKTAATARVALVSYPLAPNSPACDSLPLLRRWLELALDEAARVDGYVTLAGDSAGANVALSLGVWVADRLAQLRARRSSLSVGAQAIPEHTEAVTESSTLMRLRGVMAISPPTDLRPNRNSASRADADARDKVLGQGAADEAAVAWARGSFTDGLDPYLSPGLADLANLRMSGIRVDGVVGTADVLAHDSLGFLERCRDEGIAGRWLVWEGQMHCFPLAACYGLREGKEARRWIEDVLRGLEGRGASSASEQVKP